MRVDNLIKYLEKYPDSYQVYIDGETSKLEICEEKQDKIFVEKVLDINNEI